MGAMTAASAQSRDRRGTARRPYAAIAAAAEVGWDAGRTTHQHSSFAGPDLDAELGARGSRDRRSRGGLAGDLVDAAEARG